MSVISVLKCDVCNRSIDDDVRITYIDRFMVKKYKYRIGWARIDVCSECLRDLKKAIEKRKE